MEDNGLYREGQGETLRQMVRGLHDKLDDQSKKTDRINNIIFGDEQGGIKGMAAKVNAHETYISTDKKMKWIGAGLVGAGGTGFGFWDSIKQFLGIQ